MSAKHWQSRARTPSLRPVARNEAQDMGYLLCRLFTASIVFRINARQRQSWRPLVRVIQFFLKAVARASMRNRGKQSHSLASAFFSKAIAWDQLVMVDSASSVHPTTEMAWWFGLVMPDVSCKLCLRKRACRCPGWTQTSPLPVTIERSRFVTRWDIRTLSEREGNEEERVRVSLKDETVFDTRTCKEDAD